ncbi:UDP-3-O-[3-hydroxymyristoyl] glucosamine N-acyltransferase [Candidatus Ruthia magnifica str. Cm (Calyptogena magnifica)]|uniref:UDP-3-O-acylglucosamine N-acyltransferase n=1 Tax=Ruthia magnifica subsp. Calyptogena magnifica TaxID=413404 RepID=LPXD_RUTMC|nr:UDP-3-O-(3-hydroxymyristoyl)glucosamine N-acyltransferase [Candidatus Ruthturnera calyptogenae]A1AWJ9.1 RecName: Full=UDP-3-O-acylglucosamine N-acyltransferase [Candidatus Ruthia magnifica str. Cm (Calyptogena magnifica)]ABL02306.1 UDP-3-O-[3-hydroxymyristoyl] glucosamine N-acyltransferase [Candidatus Ruthia magnifica str. Cm (Calyptogena magnifica)]
MYTLGEIAKTINAKLVGDANIEITGIATSLSANQTQLTYINGNKYKQMLINSKAGVVILNNNLLKNCPTNALVVDNVYLAFAKATHLFKKQTVHCQGTHSSAKINYAKIAPNCIIGKNVVIGNHCTIAPNVVIEDDVIIGNYTLIQPNVSILQGCSIGNNVVISPGVVIGSEGFGNAQDQQKHWYSIAHLGYVIIGSNVSIGANTTIDRGTIEDTQIHNGVQIDNLVHIAHNVIIGQDSAIAATVTIGGSCTIGKRCMIGGGATIASHISLVDDIIVTGASTVDKNLSEQGHYTGFTSINKHQKWKKIQVWLLNLDKIAHYLNIKLKELKGK